jgi:hypothetical protein
MSAWWHVLGSPELTADVRARIIKGVHEEIQFRSLRDLAGHRDGVLLGLLSLRRAEV